jgi:hypothetical protein
VNITVADGGAVISDDGLYRYRLWREFQPSFSKVYEPHTWEKRVLWIMLNPSTADAQEDDPTIRKCTGFALRWGYGGIEVVNLYAFRSSRPSDLWRHNVSPIGPFNDHYIVEVLKRENVGKVVVAWGGIDNLKIRKREWDVLEILRFQNQQLECLGVTKAGNPRHPLMVPYETPLMRFDR